MFNLRSFLPLNFTLLIFTFVYCLLSKDASASSSFTSWNPALANGPCRAPPPQCPAEDEVCEKDQQAFLALRQVYSHLDDNQDGKVDTAESQEFVRDELKHDEDGDWRERQSNLHGADNVMTVEELWCNWVDGEAHNWTQVELVEWLVDSVELPQYREAFMRAELDGRMLPLLGAAAGGTGARFLTDILGVRIALHRRKLALKAIDVVLFGTPKRFSHVLKDFALLVAIGIVLLCTGLVLHQRNYAKQREAAMQRELEGLQRAEDTLANLRVQLSESEQFKQTVLQEKNMLELKLKLRDRATKEQENRERARRSSIELYGANSRDVISHLQEEVAQLTNSLRQTEMQLDTIQITSGDLQFWLQLTYEFELEHFNAKKRMAESQFQLVKESCEKIRKRRNALFGSMRMAHGEILTAVDERIVEARKTLEEVIADASERTVRWSQIQRACGFDVVSNPGLQTLLAQERSRLTTFNSNSHVPVSPNTFPSTSSISTASSDTSSVHAMRAQPVTTGNRFGSNSNLSTSSASTGFPRRLPNANATPADDNGLWLSIGPLNNAGGGVATNRIMGSRLDEEETSGLRSRATDSTMIS